MEKYRPIIISGKFYYTDSVPTSPKVFFLARNKVNKKEEEKFVSEEEQNPILDQLVNTGLVSRQVLEECESIEEIINKTNNILSNVISHIINNNDTTDIDNFKNAIYKISFENGNLKFYKVSEHPKLKGKNIEFILEDNKYINIDGIKHSIQYVNNELDFKEQIVQNNGTYSLQGVLNFIESQAFGNEAEIFKQALEGFNFNDEYTIDNLINTLEQVKNNSSNEDLNDILDQIINSPDCIL